MDDTAYRAAREGAALFDLSGRELLSVTGEDRLTFVHGMVTNDVKGLPEAGVTYAALLTAKGAMVGDARIWRLESELLLETEPGRAGALKDFLEKYLISEDAEVHPATERWALLSLIGPDASRLSAVTPEPGKFQRVDDGLAAAPWLIGLPGVDLLVPREKKDALAAALIGKGAVPGSWEQWQLLRVEAGVPRFGDDMEETTIPLEANLERAINYQKGCYIGQEVIARATFRGHVNKKLAGLSFGEKAPAKGTVLLRAGKKAGFVTSVVRSPALGEHVGLGYVHRDALAPGTALELEGGGTATVRALPMR